MSVPAASGSKFLHKFCGKAVDKAASPQANIRSVLNIARIAQEFVTAAIIVFSMS